MVTTKGQASCTDVSTFKPFLSQGFISVCENDSKKKPIQILKDTGASQSLLIEGVLPLSEQSATGDKVLIHGEELGFVSVPLHKVFLKSDLVSGPVTVGVRPTLPVEGVSLLLGNDLAGEKVMANPCLSSLPCESDSTIKISQEIPDLFPACAVTRAMTQKAAERSSVSLQDQVHSHDMDLSDTFSTQTGLHDNS